MTAKIDNPSETSMMLQSDIMVALINIVPYNYHILYISILVIFGVFRGLASMYLGAIEVI